MDMTARLVKASLVFLSLRTVVGGKCYKTIIDGYGALYSATSLAPCPMTKAGTGARLGGGGGGYHAQCAVAATLKTIQKASGGSKGRGRAGPGDQP